MTESMIPIIIVPLTFLFVLLIILVAKAPKAGACVVGGLVLLAPIFLWRFAASGAFRNDEEVLIPLVVVPVTFLFVLMVILLAKAPKAGAALIVALVIMGLLGLFFVSTFHISHVPTAQVSLDSQGARATATQQWTEDAATRQAVAQEVDRVIQHYSQEPPSAPEVAVVPVLPKPAAPSPIWADGIEQELKADIYSSKLAAARAAGVQLAKSIPQLAPDANSLPHVIIYQETQEYSLIAELRDAIRRALPDISCDIEAEKKGIQPDDLGVMLAYSPGEWQTQPTPWAKPGETGAVSGQFHVNLSGRKGKIHVPVRFTEKPWVESFASFANARPDQHFIVARSLGTCTSEGEAHQQALDDARARLTEALGRRSRLPEPAITTTDVLRGGFVVDQFAQSLDGSVGKIWREAMLIDVSGGKLAQLFAQKTNESRHMRESWARMGFSAIGVIVLIGTIYFFLNMATRGYYEWSLRIAGVVLAIVAVISILMVVR